MTTLKDLKGTAIQFLDADPVVYAGSWSSGGALNTARGELAGAGTQTAALAIGGGPDRAITENYNGSAWTEVGDLNTGVSQMAGAGTTSAAFIAGGNNASTNYSNQHEQWNGSAWSETTEIGTGRSNHAGSGITTGGLIFAGEVPGSPSKLALTELWNGSSWAEQGDLNTARYYLAPISAGSSTAVIAATGQTTTNVTNVESWNGSSWTEVGDVNSARYGASGSGSNTDGLIFGGETGSATALTEVWNGSSWTEVSDLGTARRSSALAVSQSGSSGITALAAGGITATTATEEWSFPSGSIVQEGDMWFNSSSSVLKGYGTAAGIPAATWATGGTLNAGHGYGTGFGSQTAAVCCFGGYPTHTNNTETYNGTAWTEVNEGNTARRNLGSFGILTSGLAFGGGPPFGVDLTESWNGTSWTEVNDLPTTVYNNRGIGASSSSGLSIGGVDAATPGKSKKANEWNGTSWTAISDMGTIRESGSAANAGSTTAALVFGGESPSQTVNTELWNGSSWTELNNLNTARSDAGGNGISTQALCFGGNTPSAPPYQATINEFWNGTSWTELNDLGTGIANGIAPAGGATSGLASGGQSAPATQNTVSQEWTADNAVLTVTTS